MIEMNCPNCGHQMKIADQYAGTQGKCGNCNQDITVPGGFVPNQDTRTPTSHNDGEMKQLLKEVKKSNKNTSNISGLMNCCLLSVLLIIFGPIIAGMIAVDSVFLPFNYSEPKPEPAVNHGEQIQNEIEEKNRIKYGDSETAWVYSRQVLRSYAEKVLKSPSTAKYSTSSESTIVYNQDGNWTSTGYIDAQNAFGATLRNKYEVKVKCTDGNWTLIDIKIED